MNGSALLTTGGPIVAFGSGQGFVPRILRLLSRHLFPGSVNLCSQRPEGCESVEIADGSLAKKAVKRREGELEYGKFTLKQKT